MCFKRLSPFTDKLSIDIKYVCVDEYMSGIEFIHFSNDNAQKIVNHMRIFIVHVQ